MTRDQLLDAITSFLSGHSGEMLARVRATLAAEVDAAGSETLARLGHRLATTGADWDYYAPDPLARRIHHLLAIELIRPDSTLRGHEHLRALAGRSFVIVANHLSYSDANVLEVMLRVHGHAEVADRLTAIAGPKVYSTLNRRFSSLCFGTIKVAQSSGVSSEDAVMSPREVARAARRTIEQARARLDAGDAVLVFAEGTRSRTGGMQRMLAAVSRYIDAPGTLVCPIGLTGTEEFFPIGDEGVHEVTVGVNVGRPMTIEELEHDAGGDRQALMDRVGAAVARLLPESYQGFYRSAALKA